MRNKYLYITLLAILGFNAETIQAQERQLKMAPRLVVNITIDQLRSDYLEAFSPLYRTDGFRRLMDKGMVFSNASFPFLPIDRASAIASIATGTTPYYNNIVGEQWLNRETLRPVYCIYDANYVGLLTNEPSAPSALKTSTISDELKVATGGKVIVFAIAPTGDAAVLSAGHAADGAIWLDDNSGKWCSSQYYFSDIPTWLLNFNSAYAPSQTIGRMAWEPMNASVSNFGYFMQSGQQQKFKHKFTGARRFNEYKASALINSDITSLALQCLKNNNMGNDWTTDMLCLTYYAGNYDHRTVTECQTEIVDTYVRLDYEMARLMSSIEQLYGLDNVLLIVSSTGCSDEENADYAKYRIPTGTFYMNRTANLLNMYLGAIWGQGQYVETCFRNQIFLNHKLLEQKRISMSEALTRSQELLAMMSGVRNVYTSLQLLTANNEQLQKIRNGFNAEQCGDILIETAPGWHLLNEEAKQDQLSRASFTQFPIIIYGSDIKSERITTPVTTDRIAPTIAKAIRIRAPNACSAAPLY